MERFSRENVRVTDRVTIEGEGGERKLHIKIKWNDPNIALSNNDVHKRFIETSRKLDNPELKTQSTNLGLDLMVLNKQMLQNSIFHNYVSMPLSKKANEIIGKYRKIKSGGHGKAEEQKERLMSQLAELNNLYSYINHLRQGNNAIFITIEEKPDKLSGLIGKIIPRRETP